MSLDIGFIGLGVMGGAMCMNVARKHDGRVYAHDLDPSAADPLVAAGAHRSASVQELARNTDIIFLSLPGSRQVYDVCCGPHGVLADGRKATLIVDLSTTSVATAVEVGQRLATAGLAFADAPVARTREAAQKGTLSIMVGASKSVFDRIEPLLHLMGTDVTHCGDVGAGQFVKLANNALVFEHTAALAELMVVGRRAGVDASVLLDAVSKGSGDSFVLRNHGMKAMLPGAFPEKSFPSEYVLKDLDYLLDLAREKKVPLRMAERAREYYERAITQGLGGRYFPVIVQMIDETTRP